MAMSAEYRSKFILQPIDGNSDFSIWVKISQVARKTPNKQTNKKFNRYDCLRIENACFLSKDLRKTHKGR